MAQKTLNDYEEKRDGKYFVGVPNGDTGEYYDPEEHAVFEYENGYLEDRIDLGELTVGEHIQANIDHGWHYDNTADLGTFGRMMWRSYEMAETGAITEAQAQVANLNSAGFTRTEMADALDKSPNTVDNLRQRAEEKLDGIMTMGELLEKAQS